MRALLTAGLLSLFLGALFQPPNTYSADSSSSVFELGSGVVVDPGTGALYLMNPQHGIDAVELGSGKTIWRSDAAGKPLTAFDDRLVAQAEAAAGIQALPIVVVNSATHGEPILTVSVPLSPPAFASIDNAMGSSFTASASMSGGEIEVSWRFSQRAGLGRPGLEPPDLYGAARINLKTGRVQMSPASSTKPVSAVDQPIPTIPVEPGFALVMPSADHQTYLATKPLGTDATGWTDYIWAIYSTSTREKLAELRMPTSAASFFVWRSILVYVSRPYGRRINQNWISEPLELRALDLSTGREMWKVPIRDTAYRGPLPPRP